MFKKLASATFIVIAFGGTTVAAIAGATTVNDSNFKSTVLSSAQPVMVDFYADWCGPCKRMAPVFESLSSQYSGKVKFVRVNVDESPETAAAYGVQSIPTFAVFKGGRPVTGVTGMVPAQQLSTMIDKAVLKSVAAK